MPAWRTISAPAAPEGSQEYWPRNQRIRGAGLADLGVVWRPVVAVGCAGTPAGAAVVGAGVWEGRLVATRVFLDEELKRLQAFPEIKREELSGFHAHAGGCGVQRVHAHRATAVSLGRGRTGLKDPHHAPLTR